MAWGAEGEKDRVRRLGMYGALFSMPRGVSDSMWRRWFHASGRRGILLRPDEQRDRMTVSMSVVNENDRGLAEIATKGNEDVEAQKELLKEYFQDAGWESERIIRDMMATKDFYYDMVGQVKMDKWRKGRVVLLGDAGYCVSPISGIGTTLALNGVYNLAGALTHHPNDLTATFAEYEMIIWPIVNPAQRLTPGASYIMNPETAWGVWMMNTMMGTLACSRLVYLLIMFLGPPADTVPVEEYGFKQLPDWRE